MFIADLILEIKLRKSECATGKLETTCHVPQMWLRFTGSVNGSNFELLLDVPNSDLQRIASNQSEADTWIRNNVRNYTKGVRFRYISVGNEVQPSDPNAMFLLPAMQNIERAASDLGIKVSTAIDTRSLSVFPPSSGSFTPNFRIFIAPVIDFLVIKKSPLPVNIDTYFIYANNMRDVSLEYALLTSYKNVVNDGQTNIETSSSHSWILSTRHWRN